MSESFESPLNVIELDEIMCRPRAPVIAEDENGNLLEISELKVMKSAAGYYVGRSCRGKGMYFDQPYCRESGYFKTESRAKLALDFILKL